MRFNHKYLIVGAGIAADGAARGIRGLDTAGSIGIIGQETSGPYDRPSLSKALWTNPATTMEDVWLHTEEETGAEMFLGRRATAIDRVEHTVTTDSGDTFGYEKLLLATGGRPRELGMPASDRVIYFRSADDYERLRLLTGKRIAVVGGGYIGTELAAGLSLNDTSVTLVVSQDVVTGQMFPHLLAEHVQQAYTEHGVALRTGTRVTGGSEGKDGVTLTFDDGSSETFDAVVAGLGIETNIELAADAGLAVEGGGVVVDAHLRTADGDVYAAGDIAMYPDRILGTSRVEHVDNAGSMGTAAGRAMAGSEETYDHTPMFFSDLYHFGYEAVGAMSTGLEMFEDWQKPLGEGVIYYLDAGRLKGVLLWNVWDKTDAARELLAADRTYTEADLKGAITG